MRKIIQICAIPCGNSLNFNNVGGIYALCNDGSIWVMAQIAKGNPVWERIDDIPQDPKLADSDRINFEQMLISYGIKYRDFKDMYDYYNKLPKEDI